MGLGTLEALRAAGLSVRLDEEGRVRVGPPERITDAARGLIGRHRDELVAVLAAERSWAAPGWDELAVEVLWRRTSAAFGETDAPWGSWVEARCAPIEAALRARDPAAYWYACLLFVREARRRAPARPGVDVRHREVA